MPAERLEKGQSVADNNPVAEKGGKVNWRDGKTVFEFIPALDEVKSVLRQRTYELLAMVREPSAKERKLLTDRGFHFLPIEAKTLLQVIGEHPDHFCKDDLKSIDKLPYPDLRRYIPKSMEVAFNPNQLYIPDSFGKSQAIQLVKTEEYSQTNLQKELPGAKALIMPATVDAQADIAYFKKTGGVLFRNCFAGTLDQMSDSDATCVGRALPVSPLVINRWDANRGEGNVGAPLAIVFLQK